jgi:RNA polymerase sigma factor (sigma-70 family)
MWRAIAWVVRKTDTRYGAFMSRDDRAQLAWARLLSVRHRINHDLPNAQLFTYFKQHAYGAIRDEARRLSPGSRYATELLRFYPIDWHALDSHDIDERGIVAMIHHHQHARNLAPIGDRATQDLTDRLEDLLKERLTPREYNIMTAYFAEDRSMKEIALELGVGESRVSQIITKCLKKVQRAASSLRP